ncbi:hypothetical protein AMK68_02710 [candidate division KD3-62 bacterium DG_56]|uniref:Uncharacterized protein n=1 Tax=candidate division KD3-62 bacterium DG_56 TaxID=1704032 RepID=A0A0S7XNL6_9BACT|nr:MAG: hypothetical protein AMK68_02710 [candidate division KD3-62 bacterium DG_56]
MSYDLLLATSDPGRVLDMQQVERALSDVIGIQTSPDGWVYTEPPNISVTVDVSQALESGRIYLRADDEGGDEAVERAYRLGLLLSHRLGLEAIDTQLNQPLDMANLAGAQEAAYRPKRFGPVAPARPGSGWNTLFWLALVGAFVAFVLAVHVLPRVPPQARPAVLLLGVLVLIALWLIARAVRRA